MPIDRRVARFNRLVANHLVGPVLTRLPGFGTIHHVGRRSGREYRTPVKLFRRGEDYVIALPYGSESDWLRNVLAAGGCGLRTRGRYLRLTRPRLVEDDGQGPVPPLVRRAMRRLDATAYLLLSPAPHPKGADDDSVHRGAD